MGHYISYSTSYNTLVYSFLWSTLLFLTMLASLGSTMLRRLGLRSRPGALRAFTASTPLPAQAETAASAEPFDFDDDDEHDGWRIESTDPSAHGPNDVIDATMHGT